MTDHDRSHLGPFADLYEIHSALTAQYPTLNTQLWLDNFNSPTVWVSNGQSGGKFWGRFFYLSGRSWAQLKAEILAYFQDHKRDAEIEYDSWLVSSSTPAPPPTPSSSPSSPSASLPPSSSTPTPVPTSTSAPSSSSPSSSTPTN